MKTLKNVHWNAALILASIYGHLTLRMVDAIGKDVDDTTPLIMARKRATLDLSEAMLIL